jgi:uncharacterized membrane protein
MTAIRNFFTDLSKVYLLFASIFLLIFIFLNPPFQLPDEPQQFFRAYQISELGLVAQVTSEGFGGYLPISLESFAVNMTTNKDALIVFDHNLLFEFNKISQSLWLPLDPLEKKFITFPTMASKPFLPYLVSATGIFVGKLFLLSPLFIFWLGRIFSALFFLVCGYFLLKNSSHNLKPIFFVTLLLPTTLYLASGISADTYTNIVAFSFISLVLY